MKFFLFAAFMVCFCSSMPWEDTSVVEVETAYHEEPESFNYHEEFVRDSNFEEEENILKKPSNLTLEGFEWENCGAKGDPVQLKALTVSPDPIAIPGSVTVSLDATIASTIQTATSVALILKKSVFGVFIEIPCVDNLGSCTYNNPCDLLANVTCPPELVKLGWTCRCPIPAKHYVVPSTTFKIPKISLPSFLETGDYQIQATLKNGAEELACYKITASLKAA